MKPNMLVTHFPLVVGVALPILFIGLILGLSEYSVSSVKPAHNFIYSADTPAYYYGTAYRNIYQLQNGKLVLIPNDQLDSNKTNASSIEDAPKLYLYDVRANTSREISYADVSSMTLAPGDGPSPDGYTVAYRYSSDGVFGIFGGGSNDNSGYFISKGDSAKRLTALVSSRPYNGSVKVIGWTP